MPPISHVWPRGSHSAPRSTSSSLRAMAPSPGEDPSAGGTLPRAPAPARGARAGEPAADVAVARTPADVTPEWLEAALGSGPITALSVTAIGTGQMSQNHRVTVVYEDSPAPGPETVVVKLASEDPPSRATGVNLGAYE